MRRPFFPFQGTDLDTSHVTENGGGVPPELVNDSIETSEDEERWVSLLGIDCKKYHVQPSALLEEIVSISNKR